MDAMKYAAAALKEPFSGRTWRELGYLLVSAPLTWLSVAYLLTNLAVGIGLIVTLLGIPLLALVPLGSRMFGEGQRLLANSMLQENIKKPAPFQPRPGFFGWLRSAFLFVDGWRSFFYLLVRLPLNTVSFYLVSLLITQGIVMFTYPLWWQMFDPINHDVNGVARHSGVQFGELYFDTWPKAAVLFAFGAVLLLATPWVARGCVQLDRWLIRALLGNQSLTERVRHLEASRANVVEDSAATLRRVERDLHDGTQAKLVAVGMNIGELKEELDKTSFDVEQARRLLETAHATTKEAIAELRDMVRNIHPPVLDAGLRPALETLTSRSTIPVELEVGLDERPSQAIESIAYFCVAELLTNVAKHSRATRAAVKVEQAGSRMRMQVVDDGVGGASVGLGSGLDGLTKRVDSVDGTLGILSPRGGPTVVTIDLPMTS